MNHIEPSTKPGIPDQAGKIEQSEHTKIVIAKQSTSFGDIRKAIDSMRHPASNHPRKTLVQNKLNKFIQKTAKKLSNQAALSSNIANPLRDERNCKFILSLLAHDIRSSSSVPGGSKNNLFFGKMPLANTLIETINDALPSGKRCEDIKLYSKKELKAIFQKSSFAFFSRRSKRLEEAQDALTCLLDRPITKISTPYSRLQQTPFSVSRNQDCDQRSGSLIAGISASSSSGEQEQLNNALVVKDETSASYAIRSAKTNTEASLIELAILNASQQTTDPNAPVVFSILSALDGLTPKFSILGKEINFKGDEKKLFEQMQASINHLWGDNKDGTLDVTIKDHEKQITRQVTKPILLNLVISSTANNPQAIKTARAFNQKQTMHMVDQLYQKYKQPMKNKNIFKSEATEYEKIQTLIRHSWHEGNYQLQYAAKALQLMDSTDRIQGRDGLKECLHIHFLMKELNIPINYQCNSGQDRTPAMLCMGKAVDQILDFYKREALTQYSTELTQQKSTNKKQPEQAINEKIALSYKVDHLVETILNYDPESNEHSNNHGKEASSPFNDKKTFSRFSDIYTDLISGLSWEPTIHTSRDPKIKFNEKSLVNYLVAGA